LKLVERSSPQEKTPAKLKKDDITMEKMSKDPIKKFAEVISMDNKLFNKQLNVVSIETMRFGGY